MGVLSLAGQEAKVEVWEAVHRATNKRVGAHDNGLDALRFVAFFAVFLCHGPLESLKWGVYGLSLFFLLSSFLITELLLREQDATGTVSLKKFYARRALRIWPLYFLGVGIAIAISVFAPWRGHLTNAQIWYLLLLFIGWMGQGFNHNPMGVLWSLSVEEIYYLIWPGITKAKLIISASLILLILSLCVNLRTDGAWYNPVVQFLFFAIGALLAICLHQKRVPLSPIVRIILFVAGIACWPFALSQKPLLGFLVAGLGCLLLFFACYNAPKQMLPNWALYLGRISFGLYVFHLLCYEVIWYKVLPHLPFRNASVPFAVYNYLLPLALTVGIAALSSEYFEKPFILLKQRRFTVVQSHSASAAPL